MAKILNADVTKTPQFVICKIINIVKKILFYWNTSTKTAKVYNKNVYSYSHLSCKLSFLKIVKNPYIFIVKREIYLFYISYLVSINNMLESNGFTLLFELAHIVFFNKV